MLSSLDRYSRYISVGEAVEEAEGKIGIITTQDKNTKYIKIVEVDKRSPLINCDIKAGDLIYGVDDTFINSYTNYETFKAKMQGEVGSEVCLHVIDVLSGKTKNINTTRINLDEVKITSKIYEDTNIGYIRVYEFATNTAEVFTSNYNELLTKGIEGLIIDLRDNPGGSVTVVAKMLELLTPNGILIELEDKNGKKETYEDKDNVQIEIPLVVLVNENSASGSEAFAEAIKYYDIGVTLGTVTFGKGVSQRQILLSDDSSINITRAKVLTPSGECIHGKGSVPDILLEFDNQKYEEIKFDNQIAAAKEEILRQLS